MHETVDWTWTTPTQATAAQEDEALYVASSNHYLNLNLFPHRILFELSL